jgi:hypothetical protein
MQQTEIAEGIDLTVFDGSQALAAITTAEIDIAISTAKRFPRSVTLAKREALELATLDMDTAKSMFYRIPRDGKNIEGPTVRMAEIIVYAWGNVRVASRIIAIDHDTVTAQGVCYDLERNVFGSKEVKRGILTSKGARYGPDMIRVTCQAAVAIAYREAVFAVVPRALFKDIYEEAKLVSVGKGVPLEQTRGNWLAHFEKKGVKRAQIFKVLDVKGEEDIGIDEVITLSGIEQAIKEGETTLAEAFADPDKASGPSTVSPLNEQVKAGAPKKEGAPKLL